MGAEYGARRPESYSRDAAKGTRNKEKKPLTLQSDDVGRGTEGGSCGGHT